MPTLLNHYKALYKSTLSLQLYKDKPVTTEKLLYLCNIDKQRQTKIPGEESGLVVDNIPQTAFRAECHAHIDSRCRYVSANKFIDISMTQLLQLHTTNYTHTHNLQ